MSYDVRISDAQVREYMKELGSGTDRAIKNAVNKAAASSMRHIAEVFPKRTGLLRKSWRVSSPTLYSRLIRSVSKYANTIEFGRAGGKTIYPHPPRKRLTIPIRDDVIVTTPTKSQIKEPVMRRLFERLANKKGKTSRQIMEEVGVLLVKSAKMSRIRGRYLLRDRVTPHISNVINTEMQRSIQNAINEAGR